MLVVAAGPKKPCFPQVMLASLERNASQPASLGAQRTSGVKIQPSLSPPLSVPALLYNEGAAEGNRFEVLHPADTLSRQAQLLFTSPAGTNCTIPTAFCTLRRPSSPPSSFLRRGFREAVGGTNKKKQRAPPPLNP